MNPFNNNLLTRFIYLQYYLLLYILNILIPITMAQQLQRNRLNALKNSMDHLSTEAQRHITAFRYQLKDSYLQCNRTGHTHIDAYILNFDMCHTFLRTFWECKPWRNLPVFDEMEHDELIIEDTHARHLVSLVIKVMCHPPRVQIKALWDDLQQVWNKMVRYEIQREEMIDQIDALLKSYGRKILLYINQITTNHPAGFQNGFPDQDDAYRGWYSSGTGSGNDPRDDVITKCIADLQDSIYNLNQPWVLSFANRTIWCTASNAYYRKYSKYAIPIPITPKPYSGPTGAFPKRHATTNDSSKIATFVMMEDIEHEGTVEATQQEFHDNWFFGRFSTDDTVRPSGGTGIAAVNNRNKVRPSNNNWRNHLPHPYTGGRDETGNRVDNDDDQDQQDDNNNANIPPQTNQPADQPQQQPDNNNQNNADGTDETDYTRGGSTGLFVNAFRWINEQAAKTRIERNSYDHFKRFGNVGNIPQRVRRNDVRPGDHKVFDGASSLDNAYIVTLTASGQPIFNPIM
jgi:hypothetical protein